MNQDATWYGGRPRPSDVVLDGNPAPLGKGAQQPAPSFRRMSIVATVAHLSYCWALVEFSYKLDHPLHGIMLTHCPSLLPRGHAHTYPGPSLANWAHYAATFAFTMNGLFHC